MEEIEVNGLKIGIEIETTRTKTISGKLKNQKLKIRLPLFLSSEEKNQHITKIKEWAIKQIAKRPERFKVVIKEYKDGDLLRIGEEEYKLNICYEHKNSSSGRIRNKEIFLNITANLNSEEQRKYISSLLSRCIAKQRITKLQEKINELNAKHFKQKINGVRFKNHKSKWGSCSKRWNINISTRLLFAPEDVLEYVCIHELAHLIEFNHSERFWNLVEKAMPNYKEKEKWLKENSQHCQF